MLLGQPFSFFSSPKTFFFWSVEQEWSKEQSRKSWKIGKAFFHMRITCFFERPWIYISFPPHFSPIFFFSDTKIPNRDFFPPSIIWQFFPPFLFFFFMQSFCWFLYGKLESSLPTSFFSILSCWHSRAKKKRKGKKIFFRCYR